MSVKHTFKASVDAVFEYLTDPDFLVQRCEDLGDLESSYEVSEDDDYIYVSGTRVTRTELPGFLAKLFDAQQHIAIEEQWQGDSDRMEATYHMKSDGQPAEVAATIVLEAKGKGCQYTIDHTPTVNLPLIGGKAAKFLLSETEKVALKELEYLAEHL
ncbi:MAG: DUF2505 domain-containing protein [Pseudomonadota bacterium]